MTNTAILRCKLCGLYKKPHHFEADDDGPNGLKIIYRCCFEKLRRRDKKIIEVLVRKILKESSEEKGAVYAHGNISS